MSIWLKKLKTKQTRKSHEKETGQFSFLQEVCCLFFFFTFFIFSRKSDLAGMKKPTKEKKENVLILSLFTFEWHNLYFFLIRQTKMKK